MMKLLTTTAFVFLCTIISYANPDAILGVWQNGSGKGHIQIYKEGNKYFGKIIWLKTPYNEDGSPKQDKLNPNEKLKSRPIVGLVVLRDFIYDEGEWTGGKIYNPEDGKEYKAFMKLKDNKTLALRGYIGFSWIGKTDTWVRIR